MSALSYAVADSATMLRRNLRHMLRNPTVILFVIGIPVVLMLLFVYVFGGTLGAGLGNAVSDGRTEYANYLVPGILVLTGASAAQGASLSVFTDMTEGIIARFRTMAISRTSVLTGHVLGTVLQTMFAIAAVVAVALLVGFRSNANAAEWLAAIGVLAMVTLAFTWLGVACGLASKSIEVASNLPLPLLLLPFLSSGFAPTDSMPAPVRWFAEHQPFTPFIETLRGLLQGTEVVSHAIVTVAWCVAITTFGYIASRSLYDRDPSR